MCAEMTVLPSALVGASPNLYHPAIAGLSGSSIVPSASSPTGTTGTFTPATSIATRTGGTVSSTGPSSADLTPMWVDGVGRGSTGAEDSSVTEKAEVEHPTSSSAVARVATINLVTVSTLA